MLLKRYIKIIRSLLSNNNKLYPNINIYGSFNYWIPKYINENICSRYGLKEKISCFSASSYPEEIKYDCNRYKIFHTSENTHVQYSHWQQFEYIHRKEKSLSLSLGFDYLDEDRYLRFPYWIMANFGTSTEYEDVKQYVAKYNNIQKSDNRTEFCSFICRKDYFGNRAIFADLLESISPIMYSSDFRHNDERMRTDFGDNKLDYFQLFKFNLCPENSNSKGYVTEKVFDAIKGGCVPIYWGNEGLPEPDVLNKDAIIYLDNDNKEKCDETLKLIRFLDDNTNAYYEFASQPRFVNGAEDVIWGYFERLEQRLKSIFRM